jgi:hypothetical protein
MYFSFHSEMTSSILSENHLLYFLHGNRLPLLAGAAGAFGGSYPPYITLDPSFYSRSSGQTSSSIPTR